MLGLLCMKLEKNGGLHTWKPRCTTCSIQKYFQDPFTQICCIWQSCTATLRGEKSTDLENKVIHLHILVIKSGIYKYNVLNSQEWLPKLKAEKYWYAVRLKTEVGLKETRRGESATVDLGLLHASVQHKHWTSGPWLFLYNYDFIHLNNHFILEVCDFFSPMWP